MYAKRLEPCLAHSKYSKNVSYYYYLATKARTVGADCARYAGDKRCLHPVLTTPTPGVTHSCMKWIEG